MAANQHKNMRPPLPPSSSTSQFQTNHFNNSLNINFNNINHDTREITLNPNIHSTNNSYSLNSKTSSNNSNVNINANAAAAVAAAAAAYLNCLTSVQNQQMVNSNNNSSSTSITVNSTNENLISDSSLANINNGSNAFHATNSISRHRY